MELPSVLHPVTFNVGGYAIRVMAYFALTDRQAAKIAMHGYRSLAKARKPKGHYTLPWHGDRAAAEMLG